MQETEWGGVGEIPVGKIFSSGFDVAEAYNNAADAALGGLLDQMKGAKTAVEKEFESIIKNNLKDNFIIYYDDLKLGGKNNTVEEAVKIIYKKLNSENNNTNLYTFWIYGWLGQYEDMHKNAIITNIDIESILEKENIRLPFFKKIKNHN